MALPFTIMVRGKKFQKAHTLKAGKMLVGNIIRKTPKNKVFNRDSLPKGAPI